ncbi:hypothetical protein JTE90_011216 [Oedothorax gibbosus]|uniref:Ig-like domain-containing protein n=1 Tax=Oedothorax gibbosus TaxID=931172 RepID=A0AAV6W1C5_9ARAC|nr:hypothetical protein JTE90_011216 [Oedothorax gibbosus]
MCRGWSTDNKPERVFSNGSRGLQSMKIFVHIDDEKLQSPSSLDMEWFMFCLKLFVTISDVTTNKESSAWEHARPDLGLRMINLEIPQVVVLGEETTLTCIFDLEEDTLYSIKWYRDDLEFFRYVPSDRPPNQFFHLPGVDIDLRRSSNGTVYIQDVDVSSAGTYKCEISADAPSFQTVFAEKMLTVTIVNDSARIPDPGVLAASFTLLLLCHFTVW